MKHKPLLLAALLPVCLASSLFAQGGGLFAGILYPKTVYSIAQKDQPPLSMIGSRTHRDEWFTDGEFYFTQGIFMRPLKGSKGFPKIDFQKIFGRKNRSDTSFMLTFIYHFDGEAEQVLTTVLVEGDPQNYRSRGFITSAQFGITAAESVHLLAPECLMVKELVSGGQTASPAL